MGLEALEKCYNVHRGLLRRLRVEVVVDYNSTTTLRQKPFHVSAFWRRYCKGCRIVKDWLRLWKEGVRDLVMELCCALHNFRVRLTSWQPMV